MPRFHPDESLLEFVGGQRVGVSRVVKAAKTLGVDLTKKVISSREQIGRLLMQKLRIKREVPKGLIRWQLPQAPDCRHALFFIDYLYPYTRIPKHQHKDNTLHVVIFGSFVYETLEHTAGDWLYVPKKLPYSIISGAYGVLLCDVWYDEIPPEYT